MICHAHRAAGVRPADGLSELFIAARFAIGDVTQRRPDPLLEGCAVQTAGKIERPARPGKILVQLTEYPCGQLVRRFLTGVGRGELQGRDRAVLPVQLHFPKRRMINSCSFHVRFSSCKTGFLVKSERFHDVNAAARQRAIQSKLLRNFQKTGGVYLGFLTLRGRKFPYGNFRTTRVLRSQNTPAGGTVVPRQVTAPLRSSRAAAAYRTAWRGGRSCRPLRRSGGPRQRRSPLWRRWAGPPFRRPAGRGWRAWPRSRS